MNQAPAIIPKDPKKSFEVGQKLAIFYEKNKGKCQYCLEATPWEQADFHHIQFYSLGGPTTVLNGQLMHIECHRKFHKENEGEE